MGQMANVNPFKRDRIAMQTLQMATDASYLRHRHLALCHYNPAHHLPLPIPLLLLWRVKGLKHEERRIGRFPTIQIRGTIDFA